MSDVDGYAASAEADLGAVPLRGPSEAAAPHKPSARRQELTRWLGWTAASVAVVFAATRLLNLTRLHVVNVLFWDHWGYYSRAWDPSVSLWELFTLQHGPHRGGVWYVMCRLLLPWTHADVRFDAYAVVGVIMLCSLLALAIRYRLSGRLRWYDVGLALLFMPPSLAVVVADTPNPTHGALPLLFVLLSALAWTLKSTFWRYLCVLPLNFLAIFTGFGVFWGLLTPALLAHDLYRAIGDRDPRRSAAAAIALLVALLSLAVFFIDYQWGADRPAVSAAGPYEYAALTCLAYARLGGVVGSGAIPVAAGALLATLACIVLFHGAVKSIRSPRPTSQWQRLAIPAALSAFSLLFALAMSFGRSHLGPGAAQAPRYIPLMLPGALGLYLFVLRIDRTSLRVAMLGAFVIVGAWAGLHLDARDAAAMLRYSEGKRRWVAAYLQTRDPVAADRMSAFSVSPNKRRLPGRLQDLERLKLSLFSPSSQSPIANGAPPPSRKSVP